MYLCVCRDVIVPSNIYSAFFFLLFLLFFISFAMWTLFFFHLQCERCFSMHSRWACMETGNFRHIRIHPYCKGCVKTQHTHNLMLDSLQTISFFVSNYFLPMDMMISISFFIDEWTVQLPIKLCISKTACGILEKYANHMRLINQ